MSKLYVLFLFNILSFQLTGQPHASYDYLNPHNNLQEDYQSFDPQAVYRSIDDGKSWEAFGKGLPQDAIVSSFATNGTDVYLTTDYHGIFYYDVEIESWENISNNLPIGLDINALSIHGNTLVIGSFRRGIYTSNNNGKSWKKAQKSPEQTPIRTLCSFNNQLLAGTDKGIFISNDKGMNWFHKQGNMQINGFTIMDDQIYAAASDGALISKDKGESWTYNYTELTLHDISNDGTYIYAMTLGDGLLRMSNEGESWEAINQGLDPKFYYTFEVKSVEDHIFAAQHFGLYRSSDHGKSWTKLNTGIPPNFAYLMLENTPLGLLTGLKRWQTDQ